MAIHKNEKAGSTRKKRMTAKSKHEAVRRVDRGEPIGLVDRSLDVSASEVSRRQKKADHAASQGFEKQ